MSWDVILPFLRPIEALIKDPDISDIMVQGDGPVFIEKFGHMHVVPGASVREKSLQFALRNIARALDADINEESPLLDSRLPDGSRVAAVLAPVAVGGTALTIRKFHSHLYTAEELVRLGSVPEGLMSELKGAVEGRQNILISGGTGSGKTTLLTALAAFIPAGERLITIEDTCEIQIARDNLVRLEARREQPGLAGVSVRGLLRTTLRLRPDRILLGEVRSGEAFDLLQALNTGHAGTLSTIHANSAELALSRFTTCVLLSGIELPYRAIRSNIADALNLVIHTDRREGRRVVTQALRITRYDAAADQYQFETLYERTPS